MENDFTQVGQFPETPWTQVRQAAGEDTSARKSLETICRLYWAPIYAFLRKQGLIQAEAEDVTQSFFVHLMERASFQHANEEKGRLRSYLLGALRNFHLNWLRAEATQKRGGSMKRVDFDAREVEAVCASGADGLSADALFERRWAVSLLENSLKDLEVEQMKAGRQEQFEVLGEFLLVHGKDARHAAAAEQLGMSEGTMRVSVHRLRKRFRELVRKHVAATVGSETEVEDELRHLMSLYAG